METTLVHNSLKNQAAEISELLLRFLQKSEGDARIGPVHFSLYMALLKTYMLQSKNPIYIFSKDLMPIAKIAGVATYHKAIRELHDYEYIKYIPSYYHLLGSLVYLNI